MKNAVFLIWFLSICLLNVNVSWAQHAGDDSHNGPTDQVRRMKSWEHHIKLKNESIFRDLKWRAVGPKFQGGRIESIACPAGYTSTIYVGVGSGNVWKTVNNGTTWEAIFEHESTFTIGDIEVSKSNPEVVWVGTGENLMARSSFAGTGVFKSIDGGKSWQDMGLHDTHHIGRVVIHPDDPDIVYVAAIGHQYSFNEERGLFKEEKRGTRFFISATKSAWWTWRWTHRITGFCMLRCGGRIERPGILWAEEKNVGYTKQQMGEKPGRG
jgi:hypothetical protein